MLCHELQYLLYQQDGSRLLNSFCCKLTLAAKIARIRPSWASCLKKRPLFLLIVIALSALTQQYIPLEIKSFIYAVSLTIKAFLIFVLPALIFLGHMALTDLQFPIAQSNIILLSKVPGIGKKTAERLVVELKDKTAKISEIALSVPTGKKDLFSDALGALVNLGYHPLQAQKALKQILAESEKRARSCLADHFCFKGILRSFIPNGSNSIFSLNLICTILDP